MTVALRLEVVRAEVADACREAGRDPAEVQLIAVSKNADAAAIVEAFRAGQRVFAENYLQDAIPKIRAVSEVLGEKIDDPARISWHFIGQLQSNKAAGAARAFDVIESLASASAARAISRAMSAQGAVRPVLLQVRLGGPAGRGGIEPVGALDLARLVTDSPGLVLDGVMGVAPQGEPAAGAFARLAEILEELRTAGLPNAPLRQMSAGMSVDYPEAIAAGATIVRIGRAIFSG